MERVARVFSGFDEADQADREYFSNLTPSSGWRSFWKSLPEDAITMKLAKDLREFIALLNSREVEYVLVGAYALAFHSRPRYTEEIDILIRPSPENARRVEEVLRALGFGSLGLRADDFQRENQVIQLGLPPNRIDLITSISGVSFDEAWEGRMHGELDELPVSFLNRECLVRNKQAAGRDKDLVDLKTLI